MDFPQTVACKVLDSKHDEWNLNQPNWLKLQKMYAGGHVVRAYADQFLQKHAMEMLEVYNDRIARFCYINHLKTIINWYTSALFKQPPNIEIRQLGEDGVPTLITDGPEREKLADFLNDADGRGTDLVTWWAEQVQSKTLLYGKTYVLFDLPVSPVYVSRAQQESTDALRPHLLGYAPQDIINWQQDESGMLEWAVLKLRTRIQENLTDPVQFADRWYWFTRQEVAVYEFRFPSTVNTIDATPDSRLYEETSKATLLDGYPRNHALADQDRVPLFVESSGDHGNLGADIAGPLIRLLNLENSHDWALQQSNLATLVLYSDKELDTIRRSEASFLQLGPTDKAGFLEQSGQAFKASQDRIGEVREEVYRLAHLIQQGRSSSATAAAQSGIAKEADLTPARDILSALGDQTRRSLRRILQAVADRMDLAVSVEVTGLDFPDRAEVIELENLERAEATIDTSGSPTLQRQVAKKVARIMLPDANKELLQKIDAEFDSNPTPSEAAAQQQQLTISSRLKQLSQTLTNRSLQDEASAA